MTHRGYKNYGDPERLSAYRSYDRTPSVPQKGDCVGCGEETTRAVSIKAGHYWQCKCCAETAILAIYDRASRKGRLSK
jgi:hypothetical protein